MFLIFRWRGVVGPLRGSRRLVRRVIDYMVVMGGEADEWEQMTGVSSSGWRIMIGCLF